VAARRGEPSVLGQAPSGAEAGGREGAEAAESVQSPSASTPNTSQPTW
jgi:hypothetical protein